MPTPTPSPTPSPMPSRATIDPPLARGRCQTRLCPDAGATVLLDDLSLVDCPGCETPMQVEPLDLDALVAQIERALRADGPAPRASADRAERADRRMSQLARPTVVAYRGLPGAGKTATASRRLLAMRDAGLRAARISRDDVRRLLGLTPGATTVEQEDEVTDVHHGMVRVLIASGVDTVLIDATHLSEQALQVTSALARDCGARLQVVDMRQEPIEDCIVRDAPRVGPARVGADRIREMAAAAGLPATPSPGTAR